MSMYAVFQLSGFQYSVQEGEVVRVPEQNLEPGGKLDIDEVMLIGKGEESLVGTPFLADAKVEAEVIGSGKADKVVIFKFKRRTKYRRKTGHRQAYTDLKINRIVAPQA
ncbi:MAG: 50S ribosomal protein L21 [bacterium]